MRHNFTSIFTLVLAGCGAAAQPKTSGDIALSDFGRSSAELSALRDDGVMTSSPVLADGTFEIELEVEHGYAFAFRSEEHGRVVSFANLVVGRHNVVRVSEGTELQIGSVEIVSEDSRSSCRGMPEEPSIAVFSSFLVTGSALSSEDVLDSPNDLDGDDRPDELDEDDDGDGLCDEDDDGDSEGGGEDGRAELPYDARLEIGDTFVLADAFAEKGPQPAAILDVEMDGGDHRLAELRAGTPFTVTEDDCTHEGNRDTGRDRIFVSWENADGSREVDHLDLRYCGR